MEQADLKAALDSILFASNRPLTADDLSKILGIEPPALKTALDEMVEDKKDQGIILMESSGQYQLGTNSKYSTVVKNFLNAELREKLTDATVEVLAIIAYRQPISKAEIEAIRGVNSQYSIRNLLMRGLIEKITNPNDARSFLYQTTTEFLQHMGLSSNKDLPEFDKLVQQIKLPEAPQVQREQQPENPEVPGPQAAEPAPEPEEAPQQAVEIAAAEETPVTVAEQALAPEQAAETAAAEETPAAVAEQAYAPEQANETIVAENNPPAVPEQTPPGQQPTEETTEQSENTEDEDEDDEDDEDEEE